MNHPVVSGPPIALGERLRLQGIKVWFRVQGMDSLFPASGDEICYEKGLTQCVEKIISRVPSEFQVAPSPGQWSLRRDGEAISVQDVKPEHGVVYEVCRKIGGSGMFIERSTHVPHPIVAPVCCFSSGERICTSKNVNTIVFLADSTFIRLKIYVYSRYGKKMKGRELVRREECLVDGAAPVTFVLSALGISRNKLFSLEAQEKGAISQGPHAIVQVAGTQLTSPLHTICSTDNLELNAILT